MSIESFHYLIIVFVSIIIGHEISYNKPAICLGLFVTGKYIFSSNYRILFVFVVAFYDVMFIKQ